MSEPTARTAADAYLDCAHLLLERLRETQRDHIERAAQACADAVSSDRLLYTTGSGHSFLVAAEAFHRAGGLACIALIPDFTFGRGERVEGYARHLLADAKPLPGGVLFVVSNSGRNAFPVEMALAGREHELTVVAVTSLPHSQSRPAGHSSGKRLFEAADLVLDSGVPAGDAALTLPGVPEPVGPMSVVAGCILMNATLVRAVELLAGRGIEPPVLRSANVAGGDEKNQALDAKYAHHRRGW